MTDLTRSDDPLEDEFVGFLVPNPNLPPHLQAIARGFYSLAREVLQNTAPGANRRLAIQRLLEAKDAAIRARLVLDARAKAAADRLEADAGDEG